MKTTEDETQMATYLWFVQLRTFNSGLLRTMRIMDSGSSQLQVLINAKDLAHDLSMKLGPRMCSLSSCPGWRNGLAIYTLSSLAYCIATNPAVCHKM